MKAFFFLSTMLLVLVACARQEQAPASLSAKELEDIKALHQSYVAAWLNDDTTGVLRTLAPEAVLMPSNIGPVQGMAAIKNFWYP
ncbi:MAG: hypothetical protein AAB354_00005, partial [candidate division KSB1 bacterium]